MEKHLGSVDIRLVRADDLQSLARFWQDEFGETSKEFPLSMFNGSDLVNIDTLTGPLRGNSHESEPSESEFVVSHSPALGL